jgi:serine/threonine-protein kinase RsbW
MAAVHADSARQGLADHLYRYPPDAAGDHPSIQAIREATSRYSPEMTAQFLRSTTRDDEHYRLLEDLGFESYMTVPLVFETEPLGAVTLVSAGSGRRFGPADLALAEDLAARVAGVVAKERRYEGQRAVSHTLQISLLPSEVPAVPAGYEVAVRYLPGTLDAEVGGDFWDVSVLPNGDLALAVGDVAGHDIKAAATMAQLRSACRALRPQTPHPAELVHLLQTTWDQLDLDLIATAIFARVQPDTGRLQIASAGHPPPLIVGTGTASFASVAPAGPLGAPPRSDPLWEGEWLPGTALVFYTDGLVEDRLRDLASGMDLLRHAAVGAPSLRPDVLAVHILKGPSRTERDDDVALLVARRDELTRPVSPSRRDPA